MKLFRIISALEREVTDASGVNHFHGGRRRHVVLAEYDSAGAMLAFLGTKGELNKMNKRGQNPTHDT